MPTLVIFLMYSPECNFIVLWMIKLLLCMTSFKDILSKIASTYPRGHWVNFFHFVFSQMTSSWFWVPSPLIWLHGRCSGREVCSFALDGTGGGTPSIPKSPICNDILGTGKLFKRNIENIDFLVYELLSEKYKFWYHIDGLVQERRNSTV